MSESNNMWRDLIMAALGHNITVMTWSERDAADAFGRYARALKDLDPSMWTARKTNGQHCIMFTNGGLIRFTSRGACAECEYHFPDRMRELGVEVDDD